MLDLFLDLDFYCSIPDVAKQKLGIRRTPLDKLLKLCEDISKNDFQLRTSNLITKEDIERDPLLEFFVEHCKKYDKAIKLEPIENLNSQIAFLNSTSFKPWNDKGYDFISTSEFVNKIDIVTYEFDIDLSKNIMYEEVKEFIQNMKFNFNFFVVEDYYLGKVNTPFLFEEFLKVATTSFSCKKKIEIIIITDFNSNNIKLLYQNYSKLISKYIQKFKLLIVKPPTDNSIHDRRIWTNSRQFYSGMGFSGKDNKGFLKALHFSKSKFSKNPKIQFKNQYLHQKGISNLNKAIHDIKELIKKSENSTDGKVINYYPIDSDGSESVKHFNFLQNI